MTTTAYETLLQGDVSGWNAWRAGHLAEEIDLRGADFSGLDLSAIRLDGADLTRAIFLQM